ncbi:MAG: glyoxalase [Pseudonocardiaceae bacterium]|nr:glyoxalase [Pseudonocardiaceae bacterium]
MTDAGLQRLDHVAIATHSVAQGYELFCGVLGGEFVNGGDDLDLQIRTLQLRLPPGVKVELMQPTTPDSYLARFLERHGPGFHHMTLFFDDVEKAIAELTQQGYELVDTDLTRPSWRETFLRPRTGLGLLQLADTTLRWDVSADGVTAEDVLAGRVLWRDDRPVLR